MSYISSFSVTLRLNKVNWQKFCTTTLEIEKVCAFLCRLGPANSCQRYDFVKHFYGPAILLENWNENWKHFWNICFTTANDSILMRSEIFWFIFGFVILEFVPIPGPTGRRPVGRISAGLGGTRISRVTATVNLDKLNQMVTNSCIH